MPGVRVCPCVSSGDNDRDVFNEKPSKEEQLAATQVVEKYLLII